MNSTNYILQLFNASLFSGGWMNIPQGILNCPPGLEYLTTIDQLLIKQKVELLEAFTGFETNNKFTIKNSLGQKVSVSLEARHVERIYYTFMYYYHDTK